MTYVIFFGLLLAFVLFCVPTDADYQAGVHIGNVSDESEEE
jgi:hypothetical protein